MPLPNEVDPRAKMATLERAIQIAAGAHCGQIDKAGQPYILHPLRVMLRMRGEDERIVAVLHDVVEDSKTVSLVDLAGEGFSQTIVEAVEALTKRRDESRVDAAKRAVLNPIARNVKLADNTENMDLGRIANPTEKDFARLAEYVEVRAILVAAGAI